MCLFKKKKNKIENVQIFKYNSENLPKQTKEEYDLNINNILQFAYDNGIKDFYKESTIDDVKEKIGMPTFDLGAKSISFTQQQFDKTHIFVVTYGKSMKDLLNFSIDG